MSGWWDMDPRDQGPPRLPSGFCGMEGVEEQWEAEHREREGGSGNTTLSTASTSELLRALADRLERDG